MGKLAADEENYLRATKYVKEALKYDPNNYDYYLDYGTYLRYQGKYSEAEKGTTIEAEKKVCVNYKPEEATAELTSEIITNKAHCDKFPSSRNKI